MRVPLAWLRDYVDLPPDTAAIVTKLATLGFPVETVEPRPFISGVVAGTILQLEKHPNADRLQVCTLDIGASATLTIATAATNVARDQVVPVAVIGAQLPQLTIEPRKMRGIDSQGMLCSAQELGLPAEWFEDGIMQLDRDTPLGSDIVQFFGLDLPVLDIEVGANRGDALSLLGIARELAAGWGSEVRLPALWADLASTGIAAVPDPGDVRITLESVDVRRYVAQRVSNVTVRPAPAALRVRLALAGQRPISNVVDISNFVMLELGQPLHFFDVDTIAGRHIIVRDAGPGERLTTLDGVERELDPTALLIADEHAATGLAGLMGGMVSEVCATTHEILIESANFAGPRIRRMSLKLGLRTEASTRNEKNLPPALTQSGAARAAFLLEREGAAIAAPRVYGTPLEPPAVIEFAQQDIGRLLGFEVAPADAQRALEALGFGVERLATSDVRFAVTVPAWRSDIAIAADLVEEIARIVGYDKVPSVVPAVAPQILDSSAFDREMTVAQTLAGLGYAECLTLALEPGSVAERWRSLSIDVPPVVEIRNPLSEDQRWMRFSMLPAQLDHAARERATRPLRTFEIGHVFTDAPEAPHESNVVGLLAVTKPIATQPAWRDAAFGALASDVRALVRAVTGIDARLERAHAPGLHPGKTARLFAGDAPIGFVGSVDPRLLRAHDITDDAVAAVLFVDALQAREKRHSVPLSKYPPIERDLAVIVAPDVPAAAAVATIRAATPLARSVDVFDEYRGPQIDAQKKSLAVRIVLQRNDATLTDADADAAMQLIIQALRNEHGAAPRG
jgi:phenylalanyl-tRNA synthetase beta chain